jgi:hypothetical protein
MVVSSVGRPTGVRPEPIGVIPAGPRCVDPRRRRRVNQRFSASETQIDATPRDARLCRRVSSLPRRVVSVPARSVRSVCLTKPVRFTALRRGQVQSREVRTNCAWRTQFSGAYTLKTQDVSRLGRQPGTMSVSWFRHHARRGLKPSEVTVVRHRGDLGVPPVSTFVTQAVGPASCLARRLDDVQGADEC